jgi:hypothetical protein
MSRWRRYNRACNFRPLADWRFVEFVRHARALEYAHEIVSSCAAPATKTNEHVEKLKVDKHYKRDVY